MMITKFARGHGLVAYTNSNAHVLCSEKHNLCYLRVILYSKRLRYAALTSPKAFSLMPQLLRFHTAMSQLYHVPHEFICLYTSMDITYNIEDGSVKFDDEEMRLILMRQFLMRHITMISAYFMRSRVRMQDALKYQGTVLYKYETNFCRRLSLFRLLLFILWWRCAPTEKWHGIRVRVLIGSVYICMRDGTQEPTCIPPWFSLTHIMKGWVWFPDMAPGS